MRTLQEGGEKRFKPCSVLRNESSLHLVADACSVAIGRNSMQLTIACLQGSFPSRPIASLPDARFPQLVDCGPEEINFPHL